MSTMRTDSEAAAALAAYRACLAQAVARSPGILEKLLAAARDSLYQRSRQLEQYQGRGAYAEALQTLSDNAVFMVQRFPIEFEEAVRHGDGSAAKARVQPLELSLVDDAQVQGHVELTRSHQAAHQALEAPLAELDGLVSSAQGLSRIQPQRNPLRPETYLRALQALVDRTQASLQVRSLWMQHLTAAMGAYLKSEYEQLSATLRDAGVLPVGYEAVAIARPAQRPVPGSAGAAPAAAAAAAAVPASWAVPPEPPAGAPVSEADARGVLRTEERRMLAGRIAEEIARLPETARVPEVVRAFVLGPWSLVIAEAQLTARGGVGDPEGYYALVRPLLWSAQPELGRADRQHLTSVLHNLFSRLRAGLASIAWPEEETVDVFQALVDAHQVALRPDGSSFAIRNRPPAAMPDAAPMAGGTGDAPPTRPWKAPSPDLAFAEGAAPGATKGAGVSGDGDTLAPGVQVELLQDGHWRRLQLLWASPHGSLLLFEGDDGRNESMTRRLCVQCMKENRLRIVQPG
ncbi:DUF1631 family protein [Xylophilus sp. Leaf220]|uniref:DUF1631 family protein n=1 Tax=Xylophilus sp. Leaf220 TaxID=1735686 RepID=UPI0006F5151E|nr:DUF1631 family protein [Xylophilus sp. Leaf220]KQM75388.1 hypothetical protein ASE76_05410 [Xylophilus sp. Leaf220]